MKNQSILQNNSGVTLLEMMVSVSIFAILIVMTANIFQSVVEGQRHAIASQNVQENVRYAMEVMAKSIRQATRSDGQDGSGSLCYPIPSPVNQIFNKRDNNGDGSEELFYMNKYGECVEWRINNSVLEVGINSVYTPVTPDEIEISELEFDMLNNSVGVDPEDKVQPLVTINFLVQARSGSARYRRPVRIQTSISSRYY